MVARRRSERRCSRIGSPRGSWRSETKRATGRARRSFESRSMCRLAEDAGRPVRGVARRGRAADLATLAASELAAGLGADGPGRAAARGLVPARRTRADTGRVVADL